MLLAIRDKAQGWFAWAIIIFISIPFALWGIQSYLDSGGETVAAKVAGVDITERALEQRVRIFRDNLRERLGKTYDPAQLNDELIRKQVLEQMINEAVQTEVASRWGLRAGDDLVRESIRANPAFQGPGGFDMRAYDVTLRNNGYTQQGYEEKIRQQMVQRQFVQGVQGTAFITKQELNQQLRLLGQKRELYYMVVPAEAFVDQVTSTDADLQQYYNEHPGSYRIAERVKIEYLLLDVESVGEQVDVTDAQLRDYYTEHQGQFQVPEERRVRHILVQVPEGADDAAVEEARSKIEDLYRRLVSGTEFEELARQESDDSGSAEQGGDLGWMSKGMMPEEFEQQAFTLERNQIGKPVRTAFGFHLIEVTDTRDGGEGSFEGLRTDIEAAYRRSQAENRFYDLSENLANLTYESPDSLIPAAEALGLKVRESDWFDRTGAPGELQSPKVVASAFSEDVLDQGNNSELIELGDDRVVVLRVVDHEAEQTQPFEVVKDRVKFAFEMQQASALASEEGERLLAELNAGKSLSEIAVSNDRELKAPGLVARNSREVPPAIVAKAFRLSRPASDTGTSGGVNLPNGDYAVLQVTRVEDGSVDSVDSDALTQIVAQRDATMGEQEYLRLLTILRGNEEIEVTAQKADQK